MTQEKALSIKDMTMEINDIVEKVNNVDLVGMEKAVNMAFGIQKLRNYFAQSQEMQKVIQGLAGTSLGFKCDKQYPPDVVTDCCITALIGGYELYNNEFNIIAGNFYPAKTGKFRKIIQTHGLTNFRENFGTIVKDKNNTATVQVSATWKLNGVDDNYEGSVIVKTNSYSDADNILGKAQSKLYSRVLTRLTGTFIPDGDVETKGKVEIIQPTQTAPKGELKKPDVAEQEPELPKQDQEKVPTSKDLIDMWGKLSPEQIQEVTNQTGIADPSTIANPKAVKNMVDKITEVCEHIA